MKSFLLNSDNKPIIKWSMLPEGVYFQGSVPIGFHLAVCPTNEKMIIVDIDCKPGKINGYSNIPKNILSGFKKSFHYFTRSGGMHVFLNYTGNKLLKNCATQFGIDLRIGANSKTNNAGGYVRWNSDIHPKDCVPLIKDTNKQENKFLESLFN